MLFTVSQCVDINLPKSKILTSLLEVYTVYSYDVAFSFISNERLIHGSVYISSLNFFMISTWQFAQVCTRA